MKIRCLVDQFAVSEGEIFESDRVRPHQQYDLDGDPIEIELDLGYGVDVLDKDGDWYFLLPEEFEVIDE